MSLAFFAEISRLRHRRRDREESVVGLRMIFPENRRVRERRDLYFKNISRGFKIFHNMQ